MKSLRRSVLLLSAFLFLPGCAWVVIGGLGAALYSVNRPGEEPVRTPPSVFITPITTTASGDVDVEYAASDAERDPANVEVTYSLDGIAWSPATAVTGTTTTGLVTSPEGEIHHFLWNSLADLGTTPQGTVSVRILPSDASGTGTAKVMGPFAVDNNGIPVATAVVPASPFVEAIAIAYVLTDSEGNAADVAVEWRAGGTGAFQACTAGAFVQVHSFPVGHTCGISTVSTRKASGPNWWSRNEVKMRVMARPTSVVASMAQARRSLSSKQHASIATRAAP